MNYKITGTAPDIFVVNADTNEVVNGPYKNDDSAKRRIRALRQKEVDKAETERNAARATDRETGLTIVENLADDSNCPATNRIERENQAIVDREERIPNNALKLAASSAYGNTRTPSPFGTTSAGVYPAISKRERRKRWNYA